jgi:SP family xylose:H+ symportor-like MFS transporter
MATILSPPTASDRAVLQGRISYYLVRCAVVASLCGLLFGFEIAVISGTTEWLKVHFALSNFMLGFAVASGLMGAIAGSITIARPTDAFGRRSVLFGLAAAFLVASVGCALAWNLASFMLFRFLGGIAVGGASVVAPVYIAELSPAAYRGRLVTITQLNIVAGILLAYLSNYVIGRLQLGDDEARWMFGVMAIPSAIFFLLLFFTPQSPRWLVAKGRIPEARKVFERCGTDAGSVDAEIEEIRRSFDLEHHKIEEPLFSRKYLTPISLAVAIAAFNQLSGINAVLYYAGYIFKIGGADKTSALLQSVIVGLTLLVFTLAALAAIDKFGRRKLMLFGSMGYILSLGAVAYSFYTGTGGWLLLASLLMFVASHAFGQGAVIWVFIGEIFPNRVRARGQALGCTTHWVMSAAISWTFPMIAATSGAIAFAFYASCMVGQLLWVLFLMPETKGVSLEAIQQRLGIE